MSQIYKKIKIRSKTCVVQGSLRYGGALVNRRQKNVCHCVVTDQSPERQMGWDGALETTSRTPWWVGAVSDGRSAQWEAIRA